jgi:hypothetical protein
MPIYCSFANDMSNNIVIQGTSLLRLNGEIRIYIVYTMLYIFKIRCYQKYEMLHAISYIDKLHAVYKYLKSVFIMYSLNLCRL